MLKRKAFETSLVAVLLITAVGCEQLPGTKKQQGAVIGGAGGAAAGAVIGGSEHRVLGALIGGALGATGGYLIGAQTEKVRSNDRDGAVEANRRAESQPATVEDARNATTADLNKDGFVTLDEVVAMHKAALSDETMLARLRATDQIFELTAEQERYLLDRGVSRNVVNQMKEINRDARDRLLEGKSGVISREPTKP
jgi:hypothetical protein